MKTKRYLCNKTFVSSYLSCGGGERRRRAAAACGGGVRRRAAAAVPPKMFFSVFSIVLAIFHHFYCCLIGVLYLPLLFMVFHFYSMFSWLLLSFFHSLSSIFDYKPLFVHCFSLCFGIIHIYFMIFFLCVIVCALFSFLNDST